MDIFDHKLDSLHYLIRMGRDAQFDTDTATQRQLRFLRELEYQGYLAQPEFSHLAKEMQELRRARDHFDQLMETTLKQLRALEDRQTVKMPTFESTPNFADSAAPKTLKESLDSIDQLLASFDKK